MTKILTFEAVIGLTSAWSTLLALTLTVTLALTVTRTLTRTRQPSNPNPNQVRLALRRCEHRPGERGANPTPYTPNSDPNPNP